jgi:hypothetical protein
MINLQNIFEQYGKEGWEFLRQEKMQEFILNRWPRIVSHLICESLGYFTPKSAVNAIIAYKTNTPFFCEWYMHMAGFRKGELQDTLLKINKDVIKDAILRRKNHRGYMADYNYARKLVEEVRKGQPGPVFASWF